MKDYLTPDKIFKIVIFGLALLSAGSLYKPSFISDAAQTDIQGISHGLLLFVTGAYAILTGSVPPAVTKTLSWALVGFLALAVLTPGHAEAATSKPLSTLFGKQKVLTGNAAADLSALFKKVQGLTHADLVAARSDADANGDTIASQCYAALDVVASAQGSAADPKTVHLVLTFQRLRDIANAIRPGSKVRVACAPLQDEVGTDFTGLIGAIETGAISAGFFGF